MSVLELIEKEDGTYLSIVNKRYSAMILLGESTIVELAIEEFGAELEALRAENATWKNAYYDVADAVARESTSTEDLCNQARNIRAENAKLRGWLKESHWLRWDKEKLAWTCWNCYAEVDADESDCELAAALKEIQ